jgi:betaine-aldehyde dehydrogenase
MAMAGVLRRNGRDLAMLDAADGGNPYTEMLGDVMVAAAQMEFFAGLVTEMRATRRAECRQFPGA